MKMKSPGFTILILLLLPFNVLSISSNRFLKYPNRGCESFPPQKDSVFTSLKSAMENPQSVRYLDLSFEKIEFLPKEMEALKNLKWLDLSGNKLKRFPKELYKLTKLEDLDLSDNQIQIWEPGISALSNLRKLDMKENQLKHIPHELWSLNLVVVEFWKNPLSGIPSGFWNSPSLRIEESNYGAYVFGVLSEGLRVFSMNDKMGIMDSNGRILKSTSFSLSTYPGSSIPKFINGKCLVIIETSEEYPRLGMIDTRFELVLKLPYAFDDSVCNPHLDFNDGLYPVDIYLIDTTGQMNKPWTSWRFINQHGEAAFDHLYDAGGCTAACIFMPRFSEELCAIRDSSGLFGYLDKSGKMAITPRFAVACDFSEGLACVMIKEAEELYYYTFIDKKGQLAFNERFYIPPTDDFSAVYVDGCNARSEAFFKNGICKLRFSPTRDSNKYVTAIINTYGEIIETLIE